MNELMGVGELSRKRNVDKPKIMEAKGRKKEQGINEQCGRK